MEALRALFWDCEFCFRVLGGCYAQGAHLYVQVFSFCRRNGFSTYEVLGICICVIGWNSQAGDSPKWVLSEPVD